MGNIKYFEKLRKDFESLYNSPFVNFVEVAKLKKVTGVYFIYLNSRIIYIGSTNNFHVRFGTDLLHKSTHTLNRKLLKEGKTPQEVKYILKNKCKYKIKKCKDKLEAEGLEHVAIWIIEPKYNNNCSGGPAWQKPRPH